MVCLCFLDMVVVLYVVEMSVFVVSLVIGMLVIRMNDYGYVKGKEMVM